MSKHLQQLRFLAIQAAVASLVLAAPLPRIPLKEAGKRNAQAFSPAHEGTAAAVRGIASSNLIRILNYKLLPVQDEEGYGFFLEALDESLDLAQPGELIEAEGVISKRGGMPVLLTKQARVLSRGTPPAPEMVKFRDLQGFRHLGTLVRTEAVVLATGENSGGSFIEVGEKQDPLRVFLPRDPKQEGRSLNWLTAGDRIRVVGISSQYCPVAPHDRFYQVLITTPAAVTILHSGSSFPLEFIFAAVLAVTLGIAAWTWREARLKRQRATLRAFNSMGEEILSASSPAEILRKLESQLPETARFTGVQLYLHNALTNQLERVSGGKRQEALPVDSQGPANSAAAGAAVCFRNRTQLAVPDTRRSPLFQSEPGTDLPRSVMYVPLFAKDAMLGVLELDHASSPRSYSVDEQNAIQHLANQIGVVLQLIEQQSMQAQLFRSEKLAAAGQLISGIANELREPLSAIAAMSEELSRRRPDALAERDLRALSAEAHRASAIVSRLVSFSRPETSEATPVEMTGLLRGLMRFRRTECDARGISLRATLSPEPVYVSGAHGQLEHVFLDLLVHAEQEQARAAEKVITLSTSLIGTRLLVSIAYNTAPSERGSGNPFDAAQPWEAGALGLGVCRGILQSHGGEVRASRTTANQAHFEVELPILPPSPGRERAAPDRGAIGSATIMVVDPDPATQRILVSTLSSSGYRVVPLSSAEEAIDLIERLRFDVTFCSTRLPGMSWVHFFELVRSQLGLFVLMTEGLDESASRIVESSGGHTLQKPFDETALATWVSAFLSRAPQSISR
jgi:C4-dicarboxylate-specific signal transduction histidine kinase